MKKFYSLCVAALALSLSLSGVLADKIGDKAKPLNISEWVKGATAEAPVDVTDGKNVYVVEFWATWCGPCRTSIPHLTELQKKYKDKGVVFVGVSNETLEKVQPFVEEQGEKMEYVVALDKENLTNQDYMRAYGRNGIPCSFIINKKGQIVWVGHPMTMDKPLEEIVAGTFDLAAAIKADEMRAKIADFGNLLREKDPQAKEKPTKGKGGVSNLLREKDPQAKETANALLKEIGKNADLLRQVVDVCYQAGELELLDKVLDQLASVDEASAQQAKNLRAQFESRRLSIKFRNALSDEDEAALKALQKDVLEKLKGDARALVSFAYEMGMQPNAKSQLPFLISLLDEADKVEGEPLQPSPEFFRAVVYYRAGEIEKGDASARKALEAITDEASKKQLGDYLNSMKPAAAEVKAEKAE
ncbi:MAG: redoxin family protein [Limisphaerales bacterium]|jgi:thiol-disulfide isomerase/thioredoxin